MKADAVKIKDVFNNESLLRIPYFQRPYVWKEDYWERFVNDMESTMENDKQYFLGALILQEEKPDPSEKNLTEQYKIIDGQQRLTTLSIYMRILHMMTSKKSEFESQYLHNDQLKTPVIRHSVDDRREYENVMKQDVARIMTGDSNIIKAYNYMLTYFNSKKNILNLNDLLSEIKRKVTFVCITLDREDDEQQIFDTINSLGVPLTTDQLMKNFLYEEKDEQAYLKNWKPLFDTKEARDFWDTDAAKSRQGKSKKNIIIERFFHAFVRIKMWDFKLSDSQKKSFVKMDNTFSTCKSFYNDFHVDKQALANEIIEYAKLYKEHLGDSVLDIRVPQHAGIKRISCFINATKTYTAIPYVLYILRNVSNEAERNRIFGYMETYLVRRLINKSTNNNYSDLFSENLLGNEKKDTFDKFVAYIQGKSDDASLAMPSISKVVYALNNNKFDEATARIVYYLYETKLSKTSDGTFNESYNTCLAEQLMPNPCTAANRNWMVHQDKDEEIYRQQLIGTLGNYFLLRVDDNEKAIKKAHNEAFGVKRSNMRNWSQNVRCCQQLDTLTEWNEKNINSRNNKLAKAINEELWKI